MTSGLATAQGNTVNPPHYFGDLNGDGRDDVLLRHTGGRWYYYPMDGREFLDDGQGSANLTDNLDWQFAGTGDLNGDGKDDVLVRRVTDGRWYYYPMDGRRHLLDQRGGMSLISDLAWQFAGIGDLSGDGKDDVLLRHRDDGRWLYYPMDGRTHITGGRGLANIPRDLVWQLAGIGDLNGDGNDDVLLRHTNGTWQYFPMDGRDYLADQRGAAFLTGNLEWQFAGIGDLNGDGKDDVLVRRVTTGRWYYYPMDGRRHLVDQRGGASILSDQDWQLAGIGDLNGDGKDDVLLRHRDDGRWLYYPMDGREYVAGQRGTVNITRDQFWTIATTVPLQGGTEDDDVTLIGTEPNQPGCNLLVTNIASNDFTEGDVNSGNIGFLGDNSLGNRENYQSFLTGPDRNGYRVQAIKLPILGLGEDEVDRVNVSIRQGQPPAAGSDTSMANRQFSPAEQEQEQGMAFEYHAEDSENPDSHVFSSSNNPSTLASGTWYHLAVSADGPGLRFLGYTFSTEESSCFGWRIGSSSSWRIRDMTPREVYDGRIGFRPLRFEMIGEKIGD